jgi:hypothetical protein
MIPQAVLTYWRANQAPWTGDDQVEQDLVSSRALVELYSDKLLSECLAFRGGTTLNKLFLPTTRLENPSRSVILIGDMYSTPCSNIFPQLIDSE